MFLGALVLQGNGPIKDLADKCNITLTFAISFTGEFLPMQIIYGGKSVKVNNLLRKVNIPAIPANMTPFFQPLDLTVIGSAKNFMEKFVTWHANEVKKEIEQGVPIECVEADLSPTHTKPTHTLWLTELQ